MIILGIETSCDETAASIVSSDRKIRSNIVYSQIEQHAPFGGVVPEIAARAHMDAIDWVIRQAIESANTAFDQLDGVAATCGPGLIGGVLVGAMAGKGIAAALNLPFVAANHLEAHALTARLTNNVEFPYLLLLVSGGHTQFIQVRGLAEYELIGSTMDDALGEAFDKTAKMLGLGFPGGPAVEKMAKKGLIGRFMLPRPLRGRSGADFSFSGLKTAVRHQIEKFYPGTISEKDKADLCAEFQQAAVDVIRDRTVNAIEIFREKQGTGGSLVVAGGVAANAPIRKALEETALDQGLPFIAPPAGLCTDNGAMIAWLGIERLRMGLTDGLDFKPRPRWPLSELSR
jgi:N6-L-threonylcarbamoyladenine synthase